MLSRGSDGAARQVDVCEPSSQRVVSVSFAGDGSKSVDKHSDLAFVGIKMNAGPFPELVDQVKKDDHALHKVGDESYGIRVPLDGKL